jgi:hypothetical protein
MKIHIVDQAEDDLVDGYNFYKDQAPGLGAYFLDCIYSDVESLVLYAGIHRIVHKNYRQQTIPPANKFASGLAPDPQRVN